jgi:hypothetical protein
MTVTRYGIYNSKTGKELGSSGGPDFIETDHQQDCINTARKIKEKFDIKCTVIQQAIELTPKIQNWWNATSGLISPPPSIYQILDAWNKHQALLADPVDSDFYDIGDTVEITDGNMYIGEQTEITGVNIPLSYAGPVTYRLAITPNKHDWWPHSQVKLIREKEQS